MKKNILLITMQIQAKWVTTIDQAAKSLGAHGVRIISPQSIKEIENADIVIVDALAVKDIVSLVSDLHKSYPKVAILVATLSPTWRRAREVMEAGAKDYFRKSLSPIDFRNVLEKWLETTTTTPVKKLSFDVLPQKTILFADNDVSFLKTSKTFLEKAGYKVVTATNPEESINALQTAKIDIAIFDLRLENDNDERDQSGLVLAKNIAFTMPKIIVTSYPSYNYVREALRPQLDGVSTIVKFISRNEGLIAIREAIEDILEVTLMKKEGMRQKFNVFVAHGHDIETRNVVNDFLRSIGLQPINLAEEPDQGNTIIEKFERYSDEINFAIALFTADDEGYKKNYPKTKKMRARQNVVFEFGYFLAKLGRNRARLLLQQGVEIPSNISGMLYIEMNSSGNWREQLLRELKDAGLPVNR